MLERCSTRARVVLLVAQQEARRLGHEAVAPEHLVAALITEARGIAAQCLAVSAVTIDAVRAEARAAYGSSGNAEALERAKPGGGLVRRGPALPYLPVSQHLLELAAREAADLGDSVVATEHVLLAFTADPQGPPARLLERLGPAPDEVRGRVLAMRAARTGSGELGEAAAPARDEDRPPRPSRPQRQVPERRPTPGERARRAPVRPVEQADGRRWSVASSRAEPPLAPLPSSPVGACCPGCGGLLEGHLLARGLPVRHVAPATPPERDAPSPPGALWVVSCANCGHVLHAAPVEGSQSS